MKGWIAEKMRLCQHGINAILHSKASNLADELIEGTPPKSVRP
jgi:hypothetical protein